MKVLLPTLALLVFAPTFLVRANAAAAQDAKSRTTEELVAALDDPDPGVREKSAEHLATREDGTIVPCLRRRLKKEDEFHVKLALSFALAFQGEKDGLDPLIDSMKVQGHLGVVYLGRVTGQPFGWEADQWKEWSGKVTEAEFKALVKRRRLRKEVLDEGWEDFLAAVTFLQDEGNRDKAARLFRDVEKKYPRSDHAIVAGELAGLLEKMALEDKDWKEPADVGVLDLRQKIAYNIYHLRDVNCYQLSQPGMCSVLDDFGRRPSGYNAAKELRAMGESAIPALIDILEDRRPIRSVGYWRTFAHSRTVLRYQDAAIQILNELLPAAFYHRSSTGAYLSVEAPERRGQVVRHIRDWYERSKGKSPKEQKWMALQDAGIYSAIRLLQSLATEDGEKENALAELRKMYETRHWVFRPVLAEAMANLGDLSKVEEVLKDYREHRYSERMISQPDDSAASSNAEEAAKRILEKYGSKKK